MSYDDKKIEVILDKSNYEKELLDIKKNTETTMKVLDEAITSGAVSGLTTLENVLDSSFSKLLDFSEAEKEFFLNSSQSAIMSEEEKSKKINIIRQKAASESMKKLSNYEKYNKKLLEREYKDLKNSLDLGLISEQEFYLKLKDYRDKHFAVGSDKWQQYTVDILKYCQETATQIAEAQKAAIMDVFNEINKDIDLSFDELQKVQDKMSGKLKNYGSLYHENTFFNPKNEKTYWWLSLGDIESEIKVLENYNNALASTKELLYKIFPTSGEGVDIEANKGYIKDFFSLLSDMSVEEGMTFSAFLARLPEEKTREYLLSWSKKQNLAEEISKNLYSDEAKDIYDRNIENMASSMISKLEESFGTLPENFFEEGVAAALGFGEGFINSMENVFQTIKDKLQLGFQTLTPNTSVFSPLGTGTHIENSTSYNIYSGSSPKSTAMEIYKQDTLKRMLVGEY